MGLLVLLLLSNYIVMSISDNKMGFIVLLLALIRFIVAIC